MRPPHAPTKSAVADAEARRRSRRRPARRGDRPPDDEAHRGVHPALQTLGRDRLAQADLLDVVDDRAEAAMIMPAQAMKRHADRLGASGIASAGRAERGSRGSSRRRRRASAAGGRAERADEPAGAADPRTIDTDSSAARSAERADGEDEQDGEDDVREEVRGAGRDRLRSQAAAMADDVPQSLPELGRMLARRPSACFSRGGSSGADRDHERARDHEAGRVEEDRVRRRRRAGSARPRRPGPATCAAETVSCELRVPVDRGSRSTRAGRYDWYATSKKTVRIPIDEADDEELCQTQVAESRRRSGSSASRTARGRRRRRSGSARRRSRSTQTPAGSVRRRNGRNSTVPRAATSKAVACRSRARAAGSPAARSASRTR